MEWIGFALLILVGVGIISTGLPAAFVLIAVASLGAVLGLASGTIPFSLLGALPSRLINLFDNDLLQALPLYVTMGLLLGRMPVADELLPAILGGMGPLDSLATPIARASHLVGRQRPRVDSDTDADAALFGPANHLDDLVAVADVAGVEAEALDARIERRPRQAVVEMDVGDDRQAGAVEDFHHRVAGLAVVAGDAPHVCAGVSHPRDLGDGSIDVAGVGLGHRLHRDRRGAADDDVTDAHRRSVAARDQPGDGHDLASRVLRWQDRQLVVHPPHWLRSEPNGVP